MDVISGKWKASQEEDMFSSNYDGKQNIILNLINNVWHWKFKRINWCCCDSIRCCRRTATGDTTPMAVNVSVKHFWFTLRGWQSLVSRCSRLAAAPELTSTDGGWSRKCCVTAAAGGVTMAILTWENIVPLRRLNSSRIDGELCLCIMYERCYLRENLFKAPWTGSANGHEIFRWRLQAYWPVVTSTNRVSEKRLLRGRARLLDKHKVLTLAAK